MSTTVITASDLPTIRGRYIEKADMSAFTWFRVGGPADVIFMPADEKDLADFLANTSKEIPVMPVGVGSNLLVRDGGLRGVVIRLGKPFAEVETDWINIHAGAAALDMEVAKVTQKAGLMGLEFYYGVPGTIGGALTMNAGAYGRETCDVLIEASGYDRQGKFHHFTNEEMGFSYRHCALAEQFSQSGGFFFTGAIFRGAQDDPMAVKARMDTIREQRENSQPIRERTGGSTFANPQGHKSWQLIDSIGGRGRTVGDAQVSEQHCNFLINRGKATASDLEELGESLRDDVREQHNVELRWEIRRVGEK